MCGITVFLSRSGLDDASKALELQKLRNLLVSQNAARGPDHQDEHTVTLPNNLALSFAASVLHMRGERPQNQPHVSSKGNVLCWNGEIFEGLEISSDENDGSILFTALTSTESQSAVVETFSRLEGPYAFVFYSAVENALYFARDPLGRRSLLLQKPSHVTPWAILSSTSAGQAHTPSMEEISAHYIFRLDMATLNNELNTWEDAISTLPRTHGTNRVITSHPVINKDISPETVPLAAAFPSPQHFDDAISQLIAKLSHSVELRVQHLPALTPVDEASQARVAVLFSGGIDCTMVALLADRHVPRNEPIDLLNVAFENPRKLKAQENPGKSKSKANRAKAGQPTYMVPDRITGLEEVEELRTICPHRTWNFVEINITYEETQKMRPVVETLMHPLCTAMDLSLALALYFASRGEGILRKAAGIEQAYHSRARVVLSGLGSDELLGGYSRHRKTFLTSGWQGLIDELEISRIPSRNMGRDDRIISSHGKESRYPFLSLSVVSWIAALPVHIKVDPRLGEGEGEKMLLRVAAKRLGLQLASGRRKRAMQFGSQSARMEEGTPNHGYYDVR